MKVIRITTQPDAITAKRETDGRFALEIKTQAAAKRETDGRFALEIKTQAAAKRWAKRDEEQSRRRAELEEMYGEDACMYA